ncbi:MAG: ATP-binding cassette domain-containing protein [Chloroflexi bacterium]|nr:ATP-binding cassette domain-containing protein [Chloroflexota bacterium]
MSLISTHDLAKSYGPNDIFANVSVAIPREGRAALVGPNGAGKTTLLRILVGLEEPSQGKVGRAKGLHIGYLPQESDWSGERTLWAEMLTAFDDLRAQEAELARLETLLAEPAQAEAALTRYGKLQEQFELAGGYEYETRVRHILTGLGFDADDYERPLAQLSGGQKTRAHLARLLLESPDLLILDEPTNHLDFTAVEWLEAWLADWHGAALVVSHDRYFMDRVVDTIWEMQGGRIETYSGNYTAYLTQRTERHARQRLEYEAQREMIAKTEEYIRRNIAGQNTAQAKGRLRRLERLKRDGLIDRPRAARALHLNLRAESRSGDRVLETKSLAVGYADDGQPLFGAPDLLLWRGECAALIGPNGAGKTTFLRTLLGEIAPLKGRVKLGASLQIGYFAQAHTPAWGGASASESLNPERTVIEEIWSVQEMPAGQARDYLARFLFTGDDVFKKVAVLSGGERGRLALAKLALQGANFLLLDEPTNHLDIPSQEILEAVLADFSGTILLVSHDRYLIDALATQIWSLESGRLTVLAGNYSAWMTTKDEGGSLKEEAGERRSERAKAQEAKRGQGTRGRAQVARKQGSTGAGERRRQAAISDRRSAISNRRRAAELETIIASLETRLNELTRELEAAGPAADRVRTLGEEYARVEADLNEHLEKWGEAMNNEARKNEQGAKE